MRALSTITFLLIFLCGGVSVCAQTLVTVKGRVVDKTDNKPKPGVSVTSGKNTIAISNDDGTFSFSVQAGSEVNFTHSGFTSIKRLITASVSNMEIIMAPMQNSMDEVVVQGFKQRTRETTTGATTSISGKVLQDVPTANVIELLQGKVAGLNIQNNTGSPGSMGTINLRGVSSTNISADGFLTPTSPLFVIDGVPVDANSNFEYGFQGGGPGISPLALIPPEDIESMDVLKDAAATSQYGSRGAYGVIIVTTRRGQSKVPIVQYSGTFFMNVAPAQRLVTGGRDERMARINQIMQYDTSYANAVRLVNATPFLADSLNPYYNNSTNWQDLFFRSTYNQTHNINIRGGDQTFNYKTNINYYSEDGIMRNTGFKRYTLSMDAIYQPTTRFRMLTNLKGALGQRNNGSGLGLEQVDITNASNLTSVLPPAYYADFNIASQGKSVRDDNKTVNVAATLDIQYEPVKNIRLGNIFTYNHISGTSDNFRPSFLNNNKSASYSYNDKNYNLYNRASISYINTFNGVHNVNAYVFDELSSYGFRANAMQLSQTANDFIEGPVGYNWFESGGGTLNNASDSRIHGFGGALSYNYDRKYVIDFSYRLDATSTNGPAVGYTENPSVSARWNFGREKWFDDAFWLSYGSIRGSWGRNIIPTGSIFDVYGIYQLGNQYNDDPTVYTNWDNVPNRNFMPQTKTETNFGLEMGFWDNAIQATFDAYYRTIDNQLQPIDLADVNGFETLRANAVSVANYGFEWLVNFRMFKQDKPFQWTLGVNGAINREAIAALPNGQRQLIQEIQDNNSNVPVMKILGRNSFSNLMYHTAGVYGSTNDVPVDPVTGKRQQLGFGTGYYFQGGDPKWTDINGDYIIDERDLLPIGNPIPRVNGGIFSMMQYKNWMLTVNVAYTLDRDIINSQLANIFANFSNPAFMNALPPLDQYNYWVPGESDKANAAVADYPNPFDFRRAVAMQPFRSNQTLFLEDGSYWKINSATLKYNFSRAWTQTMGISSANVFLSGFNLYTFSKYSGPDPELVTALGRDNSGGYPARRSYSLGINVQF